MRMQLVIVLLMALGPLAGNALWADEKPHAIPDKAPCTTCAARGAVHGDEEVAAWRQYEGAHYYFCSKQCGETFDGFPEAYVPREIPRPAPQMVLSTTGDSEIVLGRTAGDVVLLDFWATWCAPCLKAMPKLEKLHEEFVTEGFSVVGISIDEDADKFHEFLRDKKPGYPIVLDSGQEPAWQSFYVVAIPAMVLIDAQGRIVGEWKGEVDLEEVRQAVETQLARPSDSVELD